MDGYVAKTCNTWIADETVLQTGGYNVWFWDVIDDKSNVYLQAVSNVFGKNSKHVTSKGFAVQPNTNMIERFHSTAPAEY